MAPDYIAQSLHARGAERVVDLSCMHHDVVSPRAKQGAA